MVEGVDVGAGYELGYGREFGCVCVVERGRGDDLQIVVGSLNVDRNSPRRQRDAQTRSDEEGEGRLQKQIRGRIKGPCNIIVLQNVDAAPTPC